MIISNLNSWLIKIQSLQNQATRLFKIWWIAYMNKKTIGIIGAGKHFNKRIYSILSILKKKLVFESFAYVYYG